MHLFSSASARRVASSFRRFSHKVHGNNGMKSWALGVGILTVGFVSSDPSNFCLASCTSEIPTKELVCNSKVPIMSAEKMKQMAEDGRLVVAFGGYVFDVTDFTGHPGGYGRLQMAAGGDLEVYWRVYTQHNRGHIELILERYKIGKLTPEDAAKIKKETVFANPYVDDPPTSPELLTNTRYPYNAEGRLSKLRDNWITPIGSHFVRNHCHVPDIDPEEYELLITGEGVKDTTFSLEDLKTKFPRVEVFRLFWMC